MLKWITAIVLLLLIGLGAVSYLSRVSLPQAAIVEGKSLLEVASKDFEKIVYVTNVSSGSYWFWLSTNVVTIGGTQYYCYAEAGGVSFRNKGTLAITTNQVFIWLDAKRPPKIIDASYQVQLFPPRF